ncbi:cytochrome c-type biogenesis protein [Cupriavidus sp. EM10]|uniref:cytochrome c-type biogenesis protein n=1 Tax=Cupriavidus sp. EM10 TaxID=2839983 RepID=UPI001C005AF5|nr:cytochrome c-type biogenesis protein [Cupriavidus sp. EM10]QWE97801.1 cytochrome c-type biogenesis protein CcmH [Cupriavidus sp. EM10]
MSDAELDARVHALSQQLRCLVCQNQTLADSNADLAVDLRRQMRAQLAQGASDTAIKEYLVQRYGDFVLYDPPFKRSTWLLWLGPFGLLVGVAGWLWWRWRRLPSPRPLSRLRERGANRRERGASQRERLLEAFGAAARQAAGTATAK